MQAGGGRGHQPSSPASGSHPGGGSSSHDASHSQLDDDDHQHTNNTNTTNSTAQQTSNVGTVNENVYGVDEKHWSKWRDIWEKKRSLADVKPDPHNPKPLNYQLPIVELRTARSRRWRQRLIVLRGHFLYYFHPAKPQVCRGVILVKGCAVTAFELFDNKAYVIMLGPCTIRKPGWRNDPSRRFYIAFGNPQEQTKVRKMVQLVAHTEKTFAPNKKGGNVSAALLHADQSTTNE
jgi:hypothetical protein